MKIGLIADIHGNLPALKAVLADAKEVDYWICAGDVTGYYPYINEVCELLQNINASVVRGNHDAFVTGQLVPDPEKKKAYCTEWTKSHLKLEHLNWLHSLPVEMTFHWGAKIVRVRHASPWDEITYLYPDSPRLNEIQPEQDEILLLGHTHHPMMVQCGAGLLVNPGSVGQPRDRNPRAAYMIFDTDTEKITLHRTAYDVSNLQTELRKLGWDEKSIAILNRTKING